MLLGQVVGVLGVASATERDFDLSARFLETAADQLAVSIHNARLFEQTRTYATRLEDQIAERERAEGALRESEGRLRSITSAALDAIVMMDEQGRITFWNQAAETMFGLAGEAVLGQCLHDTLAPARYRETYRSGFARLQQTGESPLLGKTLEVTALHHDGREFPIELSLAPAQIDGKLQVVGVIRDISERKRAEAALRESEERYRQVAQCVPDVIWTTDLSGRFTYANSAVERIHGWTVEEFLNQLARHDHGSAGSHK